MMDTRTKHRLIGVAIIIALIVIFLPMLFKKEHQEVSMIAQSPEPPQVSEQVLKMPAANDSLGKNEETSSASVDEDSLDQGALPTSLDQTQSTQVSDSSNVSGATAVTPADLPSITDESAAQPIRLSADNLSKPLFIKKPQTERISKIVKTVVAPVISSPKIVSPLKSASEPSISYQKRVPLVKQLNQGWVLQMGSFSDVNRALTFERKLRHAGFKAFHYKAQTKRGSVMRIYIGPMVHHVQAESLLKAVNQKLNLKGIIIAYKPTQL